MTLIVGLEFENGCLIGSDSAASADNFTDKIDSSKIIQKSKDLFIGYASSFRVGQIIEYYLTLPAGKKDEKWLRTTFIESIKKTLEKHGAKDFSDGEKIVGHAELLVAFKNKIYIIQNDFSILRMSRGYAAIGSGCEYAYGALHASKQIDEPERRVRLALEAASEFTPSVSGPFYILQMKK